MYLYSRVVGYPLLFVQSLSAREGASAAGRDEGRDLCSLVYAYLRN